MSEGKLTAKVRKYIFASVIGNGLEWYDFAIFGYFSPIFSKQFFPTESPLASLMSIFIVFAVGLLSRPLGALFFGKLADIGGRKKSLLASVLLMGFSTSLMGCLPTYDSIGILAPVLLTSFRILQGISLGGEFTSSITFLIEHSPDSRRGFSGSWITFGGILGSAFGMAVATLTSLLTTSEQLYDWGWRLPFLVGLGVACLGYYLRNRAEETPHFLELQKTQTIEPSPIKTAFKEHFSEISSLIAVLLPSSVWTYLLFVFLPTYLTRIKNWEFSTSLLMNSIPIVVSLGLFPFAGHLSDKWGRKKIIASGLILLIIAAPLTFLAINEGNLLHIMLLQILISLALVLTVSPVAALMVEQFPTRVRNTGISITYHIPSGIFGGLTPLILTSLITYSAGGMLLPTLFVLTVTLLGLVSLSQMEETHELAVLR